MSDIQSNYQKYHSHITSKHKWFDLKLREVWQYKDLIWLFTKRSFVVSYKQTILGPAWLFINPLFTSIIYTFVFGGIAQMSTDDVPQILFYMAGNAIWAYFSSCVTRNAATFTSNAGIARYIFELDEAGKVMYYSELTQEITLYQN